MVIHMKQVSDYADILITAPFYLGYLCAADKFCKRYLGASKKNERLFVFFSFISCLTLNIMGRRYPVPNILPVMVEHMVFTGLVLLLFRESREKKILAVSVLMLAMTLAENFCVSFLSCLALLFHHIVKMVPAPLLSGWESGLIVCVSLCLSVLSVCWMSKHLASVFWGKSEKWYTMLAVPLLVILTVFDVAVWGAGNGIMVRSGGNMGIYYDQIFSHTEFAVLSFIFMSAAGFYVFGMNRIYIEQEKSSQYHSQIAFYKMLAEQYRQSERLRHDMNNHIIALSALFRNKEWEKMGGYLKSMESIGLNAVGDMTGSKAVDALLYQKRKRAEEKEIRWECDVRIPKGNCINEFDLCVLFGNILDNALEACERMQCEQLHDGGDCFVNIQAKTVKRCFLLEAKNSMSKTEKYADGFTNKENPQEHGIGLLNVGDVVHGYNGVVNVEAGEGSFAISVLIPLNDTVHDVKTTV